MLKRIQQFWWLILAWLLAMFGWKDFWHFNVMEAFASLTIIIGVIITIWQTCRKRHRKQRRKAIREKLGGFVKDCWNLKDKCCTEKELPQKETDELKTRMETYIQENENLGDEYLTRIKSGDGLPEGRSPPIMYSPQHLNLWINLGVWVARLNEFIGEFRD